MGGIIGLAISAAGTALLQWAAILAILYLAAGLLYTRITLKSTFLPALFLVAYGLRISSAFLLYLTHPPDGFFFRDSLYYLRTGTAILQQWQGGHSVLDLEMYRLAAGSRNWGYSFYNALHYTLAPGHLLPSISNAFAGALLCVAVYRLARELFDIRIARISAVLTALHSGLIFYSSVNLKDSLVALMIVLILLYGVRAARYYLWKDLVKLVAAASALFTLRFYMAPLVLGFVTLYWLFHSGVPVKRKLAIVTALVGCLALIALVLPGVETTLNQIRKAGGLPGFVISYGERSLAKVQGKETTILGQLQEFKLSSVAITGARFLLNPSPFNLHDITWLLLPGLLLWYAFLPFVLTGGMSLLLRRPASALLLFGFLVGGVLLYSVLPSLTEMRHRFQFTALAIIVGTWGLVHAQRWHKIFAGVFWTLLMLGFAGLKLGLFPDLLG